MVCFSECHIKRLPSLIEIDNNSEPVSVIRFDANTDYSNVVSSHKLKVRIK